MTFVHMWLHVCLNTVGGLKKKTKTMTRVQEDQMCGETPDTKQFTPKFQFSMVTIEYSLFKSGPSRLVAMAMMYLNVCILVKGGCARF